MFLILKRIVFLSIATFLVFILLLVLVSFFFDVQSIGRTTYAVEKLIPKKVGIVLGCAPYVARGQKNLFFEGRMDAAYQLYASGGVEYLLLSGDNKYYEYNEPLAMKRALIKRGVDEAVLILDFAGFRTLDSIARAKMVWGLKDAIVVSQEFHNERALLIGDKFGIYLEGFNAKPIPLGVGLKTKIREYFARTKAILDLYILNTQPQHPGPHESEFLIEK
tara:strand:- start:47 stop:706 length:660 start_codon:yes stop_codon:yes gene_type:complete